MRIKKGDLGGYFKLIVACLLNCEAPLYTLPRLVLPDQLISVCARNYMYYKKKQNLNQVFFKFNLISLFFNLTTLFTLKILSQFNNFCYNKGFKGNNYIT